MLFWLGYEGAGIKLALEALDISHQEMTKYVGALMLDSLGKKEKKNVWNNEPF